MTGEELHACVRKIDEDSMVCVLALHAYEDAPDAAGRIIAFRALTSALGRVARDAHALDVELRLLGIS